VVRSPAMKKPAWIVVGVVITLPGLLFTLQERT
jgi:hypothetical protein